MRTILLGTFLVFGLASAGAQSFLSAIIHLAHPEERVYWLLPKSALPSGHVLIGEPVRFNKRLNLIEGQEHLRMNQITFSLFNGSDTLVWEVGLGILSTGAYPFERQKQLGDSLLAAFSTYIHADITLVELVIKGRKRRGAGLRFGEEAILNHFNSRRTTFTSAQFHNGWWVLFYLQTERSPSNSSVFSGFQRKLILP